jgi:uncharacterized protein YjbI with pentapeptide repeats
LGVLFNACDSFILRIDFEECRIQSCNFSNLNLNKTAFRKCELIETDFIDTNLSTSDFTHSNLSGTVFHNCNLTKANFSHAQEYSINPANNTVKKAIFTLPEATSLLKHLDIILK